MGGGMGMGMGIGREDTGGGGGMGMGMGMGGSGVGKGGRGGRPMPPPVPAGVGGGLFRGGEEEECPGGVCRPGEVGRGMGRAGGGVSKYDAACKEQFGEGAEYDGEWHRCSVIGGRRDSDRDTANEATAKRFLSQGESSTPQTNTLRKGLSLSGGDWHTTCACRVQVIL